MRSLRRWTIHHEDDGRCWSEFTLSAGYEGPPGWVHGGICALVLDHILGEAASDGLTQPKFTGTITLRYLRGTPLGPLRAEAFIERIEGVKTFARGLPQRCRGHDSRGRRGLHPTDMGARRRMKYYISTAFLDTQEVVEIAKAADDLGYHGMGIPDHVINLETLKTPYPYTKDGKRRWEAFTDWPDADTARVGAGGDCSAGGDDDEARGLGFGTRQCHHARQYPDRHQGGKLDLFIGAAHGADGRSLDAAPPPSRSDACCLSTETRHRWWQAAGTRSRT